MCSATRQNTETQQDPTAGGRQCFEVVALEAVHHVTRSLVKGECNTKQAAMRLEHLCVTVTWTDIWSKAGSRLNEIAEIQTRMVTAPGECLTRKQTRRRLLVVQTQHLGSEKVAGGRMR